MRFGTFNVQKLKFFQGARTGANAASSLLVRVDIYLMGSGVIFVSNGIPGVLMVSICLGHK